MPLKRSYRLGVLPGVVVSSLFMERALMVAAHCDTMSGPVIQDAQLALQRGDVTPVLKWVKLADEAQIREAFSGRPPSVRDGA